MRTLSAELTAAQQATNNNPHIEIVLSSKDGATVETYKTDDATNRILRVRTAEGMYGGVLFEVNLPNGKAVGVAAQIVLNNSANTFTAKDYRGYRVNVRFGFASYWNGSSEVSISGTKFSEGEPFIVINQRDSTSEGLSVTELWCMSVWEALEILSIYGDSFGDLYSTTGSNIRQILMSSLCFNATQVWTFDNSTSTYVDETTDLEPLENSGNAPWKVDTNDILYVGVDDDEKNEFDRLSIELDIEGAGNWNAAYEYSQGAGAWGTLSDIVDNTDAGSGPGTDVQGNGATTVPRVISFTHPSDWAANTVNAVSKRYIRIRITSQISQTTEPRILRLGVSKTWGFQIDDTDTFDNVLKPEYNATIDTSRRDIFRDILSMTRYAAVMTDTFMGVNLFDDSPASTDYDYNLTPGHVFFTSKREQAIVVPNKIIAARVDNEGAPTQFIGTAADDTTSQAAIGVVLELILDNSIAQASDGTTRAARRLSRYQHEVYQGEVVVPINIGQEPWDWIGVTDARLNVTYTGRVGRIIREYDWNSASYKSQISLGILRSSPIVGLGETGIDKLIREFSETTRRNAALDNERLMRQLSEVFEGDDAPIVPRGDIAPETEFTRGRLSLPAELRNIISRPGSERVPPNIPLATGDLPVELPFWHGLAPSTGNYKQVAGRQQSNTRGLAEDSPRFHTIFLRDFQQGGYAPVQMYQDGAGQLIIDGRSATGTVLDALALQRMQYRIRSTNVAHGMTDIVPTDVGVDLGFWSVSDGGGLLTGLTDAKAAMGMRGFATTVETARTNSSVAALVFIGSLKSGTNRTFLTGGANLAVFRNHSTNKLYIDDNGSLIPGLLGGHDLGDATDYWDTEYLDNLRVSSILPRVSGNPITFDQGADDGDIIRLVSSDVAHGMTSALGLTDMYMRMRKRESTRGGLQLSVGQEAGGSSVILLEAYGSITSTVKSTASRGYMEFNMAKANGTGIQAVGANENLLAIRNQSTTRFILDADGDSHQDVGTAWTNFDDEDDAVLLRDFARAVSKDSIKTKFGEFIAYNKEQMEKLGLVSFEGPTPFVNMSRLTMLHTGAIWQMHSRIEELENRLLRLEAAVPLKEIE